MKVGTDRQWKREMCKGGDRQWRREMDEGGDKQQTVEKRDE